MVIRKRREKSVQRDYLTGALAFGQGTQPACSDPTRRGPGKYIPWFYSTPFFHLITCWRFLLAKSNWKSEARIPTDVVKTVQPHEAQNREQRGRVNLEEQMEDILHMKFSAKR